MGKYTSLSEAINDLTLKGYTHNFSTKDDTIECKKHDEVLEIDEFEVDGVFRFQEMSDVDNESILYAISSKKGDMKGLLVNSYSAYSTSVSPKLVKKLHKH
ncbi:phosphoribosylpyrophosphate synthetase [Xanthomarina sp. GH4-25]|uniref:phosphoribosylpyrophosphate synthetase n=1 Tax=Xanthomarina sp. GH4-25 TaxID=3349335 RepID=UPI00387818FB